MKYRAQSKCNCLAYALWQIGAVNKKALKEYEQVSVMTWNSTTPWLKKYIKELANMYEVMHTEIISDLYPRGITTLEGRGIISLINKGKTQCHAISYENGVVLDPEQPEKRLSLEKYLEDNSHWKVIKTWPISKRV